jgi:putative transposase
MPRMPRGIELDEDGLYHLRGQVAGSDDYYPLQEEENARELIAIIRRYTGLYFCQPAALELMGTHYHMSCRMQAFRKLSHEELLRHAERFYPNTYRPYLAWGPKEWARFNRRLFNVSELMRNIQQAFTCWFNGRHQRKGSFWAGRFRSTDSKDLRETVFYIELNAVRAGLVQCPEQWRYSSAWMRKNGQDDWLMPLEQLLETTDPLVADSLYWVGLYWRGTLASKEGDALIPVELAQQMEREKLGRGCYLRRCDFFSRGRTIGSQEAISAELAKYRAKGIYRRRRHPIPIGFGNLYALREVRTACRRI